METKGSQVSIETLEDETEISLLLILTVSGDAINVFRERITKKNGFFFCFVF